MQYFEYSPTCDHETVIVGYGGNCGYIKPNKEQLQELDILLCGGA